MKRTGNQLYDYVFDKIRGIESTPPLLFGSTQQVLPKVINEEPEYPFDIKYYNREDARKILGTFDTKPIDLVIHVRLDDILCDITDITLLPMSYYEQAFQLVNNPKSITIVGRPTSWEQKGLLSVIAIITEKHFGIKPNVSSGTIEEDMKIISSARTLIASTSTFWFWPIYTSNHLEHLIVPKWPVIKQMGNLKSQLPTTYIKLPFQNKLRNLRDFYLY